MAAIGIDLGTTNTVAAHFDGDAARVLKSRTKESFTPSVVSFGDGEMLVGRAAWNNAKAAPRNTVMSVKRLMGGWIGDEMIDGARKKYAYAIAEADDKDDQGVRVVINGQKYRPEEVSAMILRQVAEDAARALGQPVTHAVITVPAYFNDRQRDATYRAGIEAGLVVLRIIDEPTAAAVAFGEDHADEAHQLLVFDMGGGTLDISIGFVANHQWVGQGLYGDRWLGGDDVDGVIVEMIAEWVQRQSSLDPRSDAQFMVEARRKAEQVKQSLSSADTVDVVIPGLRLQGADPISVVLSISRAEVETSIGSLLSRARDQLELARKEVGFESITRVLPVGGATRMPAVRKLLEEQFAPGLVRFDAVDPMEAVALGAAILAHELDEVECPACGKLNRLGDTICCQCEASLVAAPITGEMSISEVTERALGIAVVDQQGNKDVYSTLIDKGTPYPLAEPIWRPFQTTGQQIMIPVYAGDDAKASENEYLGRVQIDLPGDVPVSTPVRVGFNYDANRILTVSVKIQGRPEYDRDGLRPTRNAADTNQVSDGEWRSFLHNGIRFIEDLLATYGDFIPVKSREPLENNLLPRARTALDGTDGAAGRSALNDLMQAAQQIEVAGTLWFADRLALQVDTQTAADLAVLGKALKDAYRKGDPDTVDQLQKSLSRRVQVIAQNDVAAARDINDYGGLLRIIGTLEA